MAPMPRPSEASKAFFSGLFSETPVVQIKPMFGNMGAFVNGNMFASLFGEDVWVRLSDAERPELLAVDGTSVPEPMPGKPMKEYVALPIAWRDEPGRIHGWVARSLEWAAGLPPKEPGSRKRVRTS